MSINYKISGWIPDPKDRIASAKPFDELKSSLVGAISGDVDLSVFSSPIQNQGFVNSCVGSSLVKALEIKRILKFGREKHMDLSVLDLYWGARDFMSPKMTNKDEGTNISLACEVLRDFGVCREEMHPFNSENIFKPPSIMASREGRLNRIHSHYRLVSSGQKLIDDMILALQAGNPVVFGTAVGDNWLDYKGGVIGICKNPKGRHAMCCLGFVDGKFKIENSWGEFWGESGFAWVWPEVFTNKETKDLWVIVDGSEGWFEKRTK